MRRVIPIAVIVLLLLVVVVVSSRVLGPRDLPPPILTEARLTRTPGTPVVRERTPRAVAQSLTETLTATPTVTNQPPASATAAISPTPDLSLSQTPPLPLTDLSDNLLKNANFVNGFNSWNMKNGFWLLHGPLCYAESPPEFAEMDRDVRAGWEVGQEDWLWQDVSVPIAHSQVVLTLTEVHHMHSGQAEIRIYGSQDGVDWEEIFFRPEVQATFGSGHLCTPAETFQHVIQASFPHYRVEIYGRMNEEWDGWLIGQLVLQVH